MNEEQKYVVSIYYKKEDMGNRIFNQLVDAVIDERKELLKISSIDLNTESKSIRFTFPKDSKFKPLITYDRDPILITPDSEILETIVTIDAPGMEYGELYMKLGEPIRLQFCGLEAYKKGDILISVFDKNHEDKNNVFVGFNGSSGYIPRIVFIEDK